MGDHCHAICRAIDCSRTESYSETRIVPAAAMAKSAAEKAAAKKAAAVPKADKNEVSDAAEKAASEAADKRAAEAMAAEAAALAAAKEQADEAARKKQVQAEKTQDTDVAMVDVDEVKNFKRMAPDLSDNQIEQDLKRTFTQIDWCSSKNVS